MPPTTPRISEVHHQTVRHHGESGFGIVTYRQSGHLGPRWQPHFQLVLLQRGSLTVAVDGAEHRVEAGQGILLAPGHLEEFHFSQDTEARHGWCQIHQDDVPPNLLIPPSGCYRVTECPKETHALFRIGWRTPIAEGVAGQRAMASLVMATLWSFLASLPEGADGGGHCPSRSATVRFQAAVQNLGTKKFTLTTLARSVGVSRGHLIKLVREQLGSTPIEIVWRTRVSQAARLLCQTGLSVAEIAHQTGFANAYHFSRRFRHQFGQPPRAWRLQNWSEKAE